MYDGRSQATAHHRTCLGASVNGPICHVNVNIIARIALGRWLLQWLSGGCGDRLPVILSPLASRIVLERVRRSKPGSCLFGMKTYNEDHEIHSRRHMTLGERRARASGERRPGANRTEDAMETTDKTYKLIELVGVSESSTEDAIRSAIEQASQTLKGLSWYEVTEMRGLIQDGKVNQFQVTLKLGFRILRADELRGS
jgi:flavin-binding protein dodecin